MNPQINFKITTDFEKKMLDYAITNNLKIYYPVGEEGVLTENGIVINTVLLSLFEFNQAVFEQMNSTEKRSYYSHNPWIEYTSDRQINDNSYYGRLYLNNSAISDPNRKKTIKSKFNLIKRWITKMSIMRNDIHIIQML